MQAGFDVSVMSLPLSETLHRTLCWFEPDQEYFGFVVKIESQEKRALEARAATDEHIRLPLSPQARAATDEHIPAPAPEHHTLPADKDSSLNFQQPALAACT